MLRLASKRTAASARRAVAVAAQQQQAWRRSALHTSAPAQALSKFAMPAMSPTMTEGGIATWKKQEGESFVAGDVLVEVETDKATMDVEAQDDGILAKILVQGGSKNVQVGSTIAIVGEEGDDTSAAEVDKIVKEAENEQPAGEDKAAAEPAQEQPKEEKPDKKQTESEGREPRKGGEEKKQPAPSTSSSEGSQPSKRDHIFASPVAKRLALEKGIPLAQVKGSGPNGRIIKADIDNYKPSSAASASATSGPPSPSTKLPAGSPPANEMSVPSAYTDIPASNMRKVIATRLTESKQNIPHYYVTAEITMDRVQKLRELFNKAAAQADKGSKDGVKAGMKLSVNDFVVKAAAIALQDVPEVNSAWMGDFIRQYNKADIAVAVATPSGLITPIVTDVGSKGLASISSNIKQLANKAKENKLQPNEYQGGTFTISNLGMFGVDSFTAIINTPQSCILAVSASEQKLVLDETSEKGFKAVEVMKVTLSADHRVVDGAIAARWLAAFKQALENPLSFML